MNGTEVTLEDKYILSEGRVYLSGTQALVRLPLVQRQRDLAAGLDTAGFVSGYRGSPLGGYDKELWRARRHLEACDIHFKPAVNEDLAATALWGTQQVEMFESRRVDGVFGIWYGKGPGVDRSMDAIRHASSAGSSKHGGVLLVAGDDHAAQSSLLAYQSEQILSAAMIPVLNPAGVQEYVDFGLLGIALSRFAGLWVSLKADAETLDSSATVSVDRERLSISLPDDFSPPEGGLNIRWPDNAAAAERRLHGPKMEAVAAFARANKLDRLILDPARPRLGIITTGKAFLDVRQALAELGLSQSHAEALGIRLYKVGLVWPVEPEGLRRFAEGVEEILVVEEKRAFLEEQLASLLAHHPSPQNPRIIGKQDESGAPLIPSLGQLDPATVARAIASRLERLGIHAEIISNHVSQLPPSAALPANLSDRRRIPFMCSGCPHNSSTRVPDGSRAMSGTGCSAFALGIPERNTQFIGHMGGEGVNWIGQSPFLEEEHVFQNIGDGTYFHSGILAIRAALAAGVNITYKILYNDAVAMTGGQPVDGTLTVPQVVAQVLAEGVKQVAVVTDEPSRYRQIDLPEGVRVYHRDVLQPLQEEFREIPGTTVLVYDQTCAAEKRRRRKRNQFPDPPRRVFINREVCEACGDCSNQSNCISVKPEETELGIKRRIDQSSCNKDYSCVAGFCPSFVSVIDPKLRQAPDDLHVYESELADLPDPPLKARDDPYNILLTGIGGTGVITAGSLLGMAAHLERKGSTVLDVTGVAQKNGAVTSHVRLSADPNELFSVRIGRGKADLVLACDMVVATASPNLSRISRGKSFVVANADIEPTAAFVIGADSDLHAENMRRDLQSAAGERHLEILNATTLAERFAGDAIAANLLMLGYCYQLGLLPLSLWSLERAIELNGTAAERNKKIFHMGRLAAHRPSLFERNGASRHRVTAVEPTAAELIADRATRLVDYQDESYADRFREIMAHVVQTEANLGPSRDRFSRAVAISLYKLMAYKDEYEVARLYTRPEFRAGLEEQFESFSKVKIHLAPPLLSRGKDAAGRPKKREFGPWVFHLFHVLARLKRLRGTPLDLLGLTAERRMERGLIGRYETIVRELCEALDAGGYDLAVEIASVPQLIRGFGPIKEANARYALEEWEKLLEKWRSNVSLRAAA